MQTPIPMAHQHRLGGLAARLAPMRPDDGNKMLLLVEHSQLHKQARPTVASCWRHVAASKYPYPKTGVYRG